MGRKKIYADESEILELADAFRFDFAFVPRDWLKIQGRFPVLRRDESGFVIELWWSSPVDSNNFIDCFNRYLGADSRHGDQDDLIEIAWELEGNHSVILWIAENGNIAHLDGKVEVRTDFGDAISKICRVAMLVNCQFFDRKTEQFIEASSIEMHSAIIRSNASHLATSKLGRFEH
jgi:hypothetical protein